MLVSIRQQPSRTPSQTLYLTAVVVCVCVAFPGGIVPVECVCVRHSCVLTALHINWDIAKEK